MNEEKEKISLADRETIPYAQNEALLSHSCPSFRF
jgi:hypothetical protein